MDDDIAQIRQRFDTAMPTAKAIKDAMDWPRKRVLETRREIVKREKARLEELRALSYADLKQRAESQLGRDGMAALPNLSRPVLANALRKHARQAEAAIPGEAAPSARPATVEPRVNPLIRADAELQQAAASYRDGDTAPMQEWLQANDPAYAELTERLAQAEIAKQSERVDELQRELEAIEIDRVLEVSPPGTLPSEHQRAARDAGIIAKRPAEPDPGRDSVSAVEIGPSAESNQLRRIERAVPEAGLRIMGEALGIEGAKDMPRAELAKRIGDTRDQHDTDSGSLTVMHSGAIWRVPFQAAGDLARGVYNLGLIDLVDRLRRSVPGDERIQRAADAGRKASLDAKGLYGEITPTLKPVLWLTGRSPVTRPGRALASLQEVVWDADNASGVTRVRLALENKLPADRKLSDDEQRIVKAMKKLIAKTGEMSEREGLMQYNHLTKEWTPFVAREHVMPRMASLWLIDTMMKGEGERFDRLVKVLAERNKMPEEEVRAALTQQRAEMMGLEGDDSAFRRINAEFARVWREFPDFLRDPETNLRIELLESNPYRFSDRLADLTANRLAYVRHFGQETDKKSLANELADIIRDRLGGSDPLIALTRSLNGMPVERPFYTQPGSGLHELMLAYHYGQSLLRAGALSMTWVPNSVEPMANIQALSGGPLLRDFWVALWKNFGGLERRRATQAYLEEIGAIGLWVRNLSWDPQRPVESMVRVGRELPIILVRSFWRSQEKLAASVGMAKAERMMAGKGTAGDVVDVMAMLNVSRAEARKMKRGEGDPEQYLRLVQRAGAFTTNSPMARAEQSRIEHSRLFRVAFAFTQYALMKTRWLGQFGPVWWDSVKNLHESTRKVRELRPVPQADGTVVETPGYRQAKRERAEAWKEAAAATAKIGRMVAGTTIAGAAQYFLMAFVTGGKLGLNIAWNEAKDAPWRFLLDSFAYTMFAGPLGAILRTTEDQSRAWYESVARVTWPGSLAVEATDFVRGTGRYRDRGHFEKLAQAGDRFVPINRMFWQGAAAIGYQDERQRMETAVRAFWRAKGRIDPQGRFVPTPAESTVREVREQMRAHAEFRKHMRRAAEVIRGGGDPQYHIDAALGVDGADRAAVRRSLLGKRLLIGTIGEPGHPANDALRSRIGEDAYRLIEQHDEMLQDWADSLRGRR
jgi:hypothetical protein